MVDNHDLNGATQRACIVHRMGHTVLTLKTDTTERAAAAERGASVADKNPLRALDNDDEEVEYRVLLKAHVYNVVNGLYRFVFVLMLLLPATLLCQVTSVGSTSWVWTRCGGARKEIGIFAACPMRSSPRCEGLESMWSSPFAAVTEHDAGRRRCEISATTSRAAHRAVFALGVAQLVCQLVMVGLLWRLFLRATRQKTALVLLLFTMLSSTLGISIAVIFAWSTRGWRRSQTSFLSGAQGERTFPSGFGWGFRLYIGALGMHGALLAAEVLLVRFCAEVKVHARQTLHTDRRRRWVQRQLEIAKLGVDGTALPTFLQERGAGQRSWLVDVVATPVELYNNTEAVTYKAVLREPPVARRESESSVNEPASEDSDGRLDWEDGPAPHQRVPSATTPSYATPCLETNCGTADDWVYDTKTDLLYSAKCDMFWDPAQQLFFNRFLHVWQYSPTRLYELTM